MNDKRTLRLATLINEETLNRNIKWNRSSNVNCYRVSLGIGMVEIRFDYDPIMLPDGSMSPIYQFTVYNDKNEIIDFIASHSDNDEHHLLLKKLYEIAESNYLNKDETFESMFNDLSIF